MSKPEKLPHAKWLKIRRTPANLWRRLGRFVWTAGTAVRLTECRAHGKARVDNCPGCREAKRRLWFASQCNGNAEGRRKAREEAEKAGAF